MNHFMRSKLRCLSSFEFRSKVKFQFRVIRDFHIEQKLDGARKTSLLSLSVTISVPLMRLNSSSFASLSQRSNRLCSWLGLEFALGSVLVL